MAAKKGKGAKKAKVADQQSAAREDLIEDAGGYDWGWPTVDIVLANMELSQRLVAGGFSGCGFGLLPDGPPFMTLLGDDMGKMRSALALLKEWTTLSGPNAIRIEIAYDGPGYVLAISQQVDLLRWRVSGIDTISQPLMIVMSHIKRMNSRHPMLDGLAGYAEQPVAPLWLIVAEMPAGMSQSSGSRDFSFKPSWNNAILLPGIDVYRRLEDRPPHSMARTEAEFEARKKDGPDPGWPPTPDQDPKGVTDARERRLAASMPKTLHVLRNTDRGAALLAHAASAGYARWQAEQAICNLRTARFLSYQPSGIGKRLAMIDAVRRQILEPASMDVELTAISNDQLDEQIGLDAAFLLRRLEPDRDVGARVVERIRRVRELGYG
ncbi:hypothetical protein [Sphingomonas albertensis]|uniref:Uncharacterized protein n=1 Tax=Sphingomonas albertensis TaxID=2762591 RepID=A0ABR7AJI8_9SPHN|nr:hypothetical protein [Sphingomonas albertensis]MBC3940623.1 hypothetical protein [Sphingomonas albertensis]